MEGNPPLGQFEDLLRAYLAKYVAWESVRDDYVKLYVDTHLEELKAQVTERAQELEKTKQAP
jgi:hypothetical protein